jgi:hypothetical protein
MQTPAMLRPACGRTSGRPTMGGAAMITCPQLEQKRAVLGNPVPQRLQNIAMMKPPLGFPDSL